MAVAFARSRSRQITAASPRPATVKSIEIFDAATGEAIMKLAARPAKIYSLTFLDSQHLATGGSDNRITVWDLDSKEAAFGTRRPHRHGRSLGLRCDGKSRGFGQLRYNVENLESRRTPRTGDGMAHRQGFVALTQRGNFVRRHECTEAARGNF